MSARLTSRNHYNPCFWTALWNEAYYRKCCAGKEIKGLAREQSVYALNLRADKILVTTVERVHYHKDLGVAEITAESAKEFCRRWYPEEYANITESFMHNESSYYLDFEETLSGLENAAKYSSLILAAKLGTLASVEHKGFLICTLIIHAMRSYEFMSTTIARMRSEGVEKWEYFWLLRNAWGTSDFLARAVLAPALGEWTFWRSPSPVFPLCDSPVMFSKDSLMAVLSPRLLLEIDLNIPLGGECWRVKEGVPHHKYAEFRRRSLANSFKEILFHEPALLSEWQSSTHYADRVAALRDPEKREECLREAAARIRFALGGFGRR